MEQISSTFDTDAVYQEKYRGIIQETSEVSQVSGFYCNLQRSQRLLQPKLGTSDANASFFKVSFNVKCHKSVRAPHSSTHGVSCGAGEHS